MIRIKKWMIMLVFVIINLIIISDVKAVSYTALPTPMSTTYQSFFESYFKDRKFSYFSYSCTYGGSNRTCYYGIDLETSEYINFIYSCSGTNCSVDSVTGIDKNFSVSGATVVKKNIGYDFRLYFLIGFIFIFLIFLYLIFGISRRKGRRG